MSLGLVVATGCGGDGAEPSSPDAAVATDQGTPAPDGPLEPDQAPPGPDAVSPDAAGADARPADAASPDAAPVDRCVDLPTPGTGVRVEVDLARYTATPPPGGLPDAGPARVSRIADAAQLIGGPAATGRVGDYLFDNGVARFIVEQPGRQIGVCPYGGNVIDGDRTRSGDPTGHDAIGEQCLFVNLGRTLAHAQVEVLADGSDGGAAVLAATGRLELLDFISVPGLLHQLPQQLGVDINIDPPFDIDAQLPVTGTTYYLQHPGDLGLQVVTALRNDGDAPLRLVVGQIIDSGGGVDFMNPMNGLGGFGYRGIGAGGFAGGTLDGDPLPYLGFIAKDAAHLYAPEPVPGLHPMAPLPTAGVSVQVSGVAVSLLGAQKALNLLLDATQTQPGWVVLEPGETTVRAHWLLVGSGSPAELVDAALTRNGTPGLAVVSGTLSGPGAPGTRVSAVDAAGRALNAADAAADGTWSMRLPAGTYTLRALNAGDAAVEAPLEVAGAAVQAPALTLAAAGTLDVTVRTPAGTPTPAKVTVECIGDCPAIPAGTQRDVSLDGPFPGLASVRYAGLDGHVEVPLAPGRYRVWSSRGQEWSVDSTEVTVAGGEVTTVAAEIAHVVDTTGVASGDFHVHSLPSPDSPVALTDRVLSFMGEGVDLLVSTDHDVITDFGPTIAAMGAGQELATLIGTELTTFDYGHYNGFPLTRDATSPNGGAFDWAGGTGRGKTPGEILAWFDTFPGEQVVQANHVDGGYFSAFEVDPLYGTTTVDPTAYRLPCATPDPVTGDTGLFSEAFTAIEVMNGPSMDRVHRITRWWLQMVGRGLRTTATAVSDTHKLYRDLEGGMRTYVWVDGPDSPGALTAEPFVAATNAGRAMGSNGPFFTVRVFGADGDEGGLGDTVSAVPGVPVTLEVTVDAPEWLTVDTVDLIANVPADDLRYEPCEGAGRGCVEGRRACFATAAGCTTPVPVTQSVRIPWEPSDLRDVATGTRTHRHRVRTVRVDYVPEAGSDAYAMVVVRGETPGMFPVVRDRDTLPYAFSNPVFLDTDGGGYDHPPLLALAAAGPPVALKSARARRVGARPLTARDVEALVERAHHD